MNNTEKIKQKAVELGFDLAGITSAKPLSADEVEVFQKWLGMGYAGQMNYMHNNLDKRTNPANLLNGAESVIVAGVNYNFEQPLPKSATSGQIARYAQFQDYHIFVKDMLRKLAEYIKTEIDANAKFKICVDSVPLAERALAVRAGLGFIGRNHMLINPQYGMEIFLGEIITTAELETDEPFDCQCAGCDRCIRQCPTGALGADGWFDASKCISYLTIEHKGMIKKKLAENMGSRIFGCDRCVLVCPHYKSSPPAENKNIKPEISEIELDEIIKMTENDFKLRFKDSPVYRTGLGNLKRNASLCIANQNTKP